MHFFSKSLTRNHIDIPQNNSHMQIEYLCFAPL
eukprot:COSAG06_NODE_64348_length_259_cov_5.312500_1_plen_32_part_01